MSLIAIRVIISFSESEKELYEWLLSKTSMKNKYRRGISEFIKDVLWSEYMAERRDPIRLWMFVAKELMNQLKCRWCGGKPRLIGIEGNKLALYCDRCQVTFTESIVPPWMKLEDIPIHMKLDLDTDI
jgi:hypothetical protein